MITMRVTLMSFRRGGVPPVILPYYAAPHAAVRRLRVGHAPETDARALPALSAVRFRVGGRVGTDVRGGGHRAGRVAGDDRRGRDPLGFRLALRRGHLGRGQA